MNAYQISIPLIINKTGFALKLNLNFNVFLAWSIKINKTKLKIFKVGLVKNAHIVFALIVQQLINQIDFNLLYLNYFYFI